VLEAIQARKRKQRLRASADALAQATQVGG
jgi:hypothetical protein